MMKIISSLVYVRGFGIVDGAQFFMMRGWYEIQRGCQHIFDG